ncbi:hypothetical protein [Bradyrhizobium australafricanum]|nr:hypothetical protein [Bradyrhizobium australafricanum]
MGKVVTGWSRIQPNPKAAGHSRWHDVKAYEASQETEGYIG